MRIPLGNCKTAVSSSTHIKRNVPSHFFQVDRYTSPRAPTGTVRKSFVPLLACGPPEYLKPNAIHLFAFSGCTSVLAFSMDTILSNWLVASDCRSGFVIAPETRGVLHIPSSPTVVLTAYTAILRQSVFEVFFYRSSLVHVYASLKGALYCSTITTARVSQWVLPANVFLLSPGCISLLNTC